MNKFCLISDARNNASWVLILFVDFSLFLSQFGVYESIVYFYCSQSHYVGLWCQSLNHTTHSFTIRIRNVMLLKKEDERKEETNGTKLYLMRLLRNDAHSVHFVIYLKERLMMMLSIPHHHLYLFYSKSHSVFLFFILLLCHALLACSMCAIVWQKAKWIKHHELHRFSFLIVAYTQSATCTRCMHQVDAAII